MLVAVAAFAFKCGIHKRDSCETAYKKYLKCYPEKSFSQEGKETFCSALAVLVRPNCTSCDVTPMMDRKFHGNTKIATKTAKTDDFEKTYKLDFCEVHIDEVMSPLDEIWSSIDLGEAKLVTPPRNQGTCNSCYAFGATASLENAVLLNKIESQTWSTDPNKLDISEMFIMMNLYDSVFSGDYCEGGDFVPAVNQAMYDKTFELESDYPYSNWSNARPDHDPEHGKYTTYESKLTESDHYLHLKVFY